MTRFRFRQVDERLHRTKNIRRPFLVAVESARGRAEQGPRALRMILVRRERFPQTARSSWSAVEALASQVETNRPEPGTVSASKAALTDKHDVGRGESPTVPA